MGLSEAIDSAGAIYRHNIKPFLFSSTLRLNRVCLVHVLSVLYMSHLSCTCLSPHTVRAAACAATTLRQLHSRPRLHYRLLTLCPGASSGPQGQ